MEVEGRVWVVGDSVTTDAMYPGYAMKLPLAEAARHVFYELRPGWTDEVRDGDTARVDFAEGWCLNMSSGVGLPTERRFSDPSRTFAGS